jgi:N-acetylneuraminic acid mutarotase
LATACGAPTPVDLPAGGWFAAMVYDSAADRTILFGGDACCPGGLGGQRVLNETWAFDLNSNTWQNRTRDPNPGPRIGAAMAYDARADRTVLFGGTRSFESPFAIPWKVLSDTWTYDYANNSWSNVTSALQGSPPPRMGAFMAFDTQSQRIVLFGGASPGAIATQETWVLDLANLTWTSMDPATPAPPRALGGVAYEPIADRTVVFGGYGGNTEVNETYGYDLETNTWENLTAAVAPPPRQVTGMTYDADLKRVLLYGGQTVAIPMFDDFWTFEYATRAWVRVQRTPSPQGAVGALMAYDAESGRSVLFGGVADQMTSAVSYSGDHRRAQNHTWAFDGANSSWAPLDRTSAAVVVSAQGVPAGVSLSWAWYSPPGDQVEVAAFHIYRAAPGEGLCLLQETSAPRFVDNQTSPEVGYTYAVAPVGPTGEGHLSNVVEAKALPQAVNTTGESDKPSGPIGPLLQLPTQAGAVVIIAIVLSFFAGAIFNEFAFKRIRRPPEE